MHCCIFVATLNTYIVDSYIHASNNKKRTYCCISMAAVVMWTCHNVLWYIKCLCCYTFLYWNTKLFVTFDICTVFQKMELLVLFVNFLKLPGFGMWTCSSCSLKRKRRFMLSIMCMPICGSEVCGLHHKQYLNSVTGFQL
jgi:hypothetical protein